jgi:ATP-dependent metalloprotease
MADVKVDTAIDASVIARGCPGMSGADLQNLVNQVSQLLLPCESELRL